jgi:hypothetical protein
VKSLPDLVPRGPAVHRRRYVIEPEKPANAIRGDLVLITALNLVAPDSQGRGHMRYGSHPQYDGAVADRLEAP